MKKIKTTDGIASWKLDSGIERFLAKQADKSYFWKKLYVKLYKIFDRDYFGKGMKFVDRNIELFVGKVSKKAKKKLVVDMIYSLHRFGCGFDEYFLYNFQNLDARGRETFITDKIRWQYYRCFNTDENNAIFNDKKRCYDLFGKFYKRKLLLVKDINDKKHFINFCKGNTDFVVKPLNSSGGRGVYREKATGNINILFDKILQQAPVVIEGVIKQSVEMSSLHPQSVNTLRIPTIRDKNGVHLFHPLVRIGVGDSAIDNATAGGIFCLVNQITGKVCSNARDEKGNQFEFHPDTDVRFEGFQIPDWQQVVALVKDLAMVVEGNNYVGWDLAHTQDGWVMVEGNPRGQIVMMQLFYERGFKQEIEEYIANL